MNNNTSIPGRFIPIIFCLLISTGLRSQVTLNCESGNKAIDQGNCWGFGATNYSNTANLVISGQWSTRSNSLTNSNTNACWIKTPWMLPGSGNITFQSRLDGNGNGVTAKTIHLFYIPFDQSAPYGEGTAVEFYLYNFPAFNVTTIRDISVSIPPVIQNASTPYRFRVSFTGTGGNERAYSDNFVFPGTYWSDPSNLCNPLAVIQDADGDGVADSEDNYPNDPYRAYNNYYPSSTGYGSLAFEDSWPNHSDYDMNDLVVDYQFNTVTNSSNNVVEIRANVIAKATGATFRNGFGLQLDGIPPSKIYSCSGNIITPNSIYNFLPNGMEAGQTYANCIVFDNFYKVLEHPGSGTGINTSPGAPFVPYDTIPVLIEFIHNGVPASGGTVSINQLGSGTFNFYMVRNLQRGNEIHLADRIPTSLANTSLFGTGIDDSDPSQGKYYKTANNLPWGINIIQGFEYPAEKSAINDAYLHFIDWAVSSGADYPDWYTNHPGYRNPAQIY